MSSSLGKRSRLRQRARNSAARRLARLSPEVEAQVEASLGHSFTDRSLLEMALTHASAAQSGGYGSNERLEFLGDRVLGLVTAERLYRDFSEESEGSLAPRLNALVDRSACAKAAEMAGLGAALLLDAGEDASGGRTKASVLSDAMEAVLGAVYLDAGLEAARGVIDRLWPSQSDRPTARQARPDPPKDPKTALQEWAQGRGHSLPAYDIIDRSGPDHAPVFTVRCAVPGLGEALGQGGSRQNAEREAAAALLQAVKSGGL
jgi:ribonuclease-3